MSRSNLGAMILCFALVALALPAVMIAGEWDKSTTITFSGPFEVPGVGAQILPAGTYVFKLLGAKTDRHIVQIWNERQDHIFSTILAIPNYRFKETNKTVLTFRERAAGEPKAIRAWFYPGNIIGQEFVYPKARAIELAKFADQPVLAMPSELAENLVAPINSADEPQAIALEQAPVEAVKPSGETVAMSEVVEPPPVQTAELSAPSMPKTAGLLPLLGLVGFLAIVAGLGLSLVSKRVV